MDWELAQEGLARCKSNVRTLQEQRRWTRTWGVVLEPDLSEQTLQVRWGYVGGSTGAAVGCGRVHYSPATLFPNEASVEREKGVSSFSSTRPEVREALGDYVKDHQR